ncbi:MipA/OmpV family protein [Sphingomonas cannabina]|uniref:MipA/OmpV family protein n=1 Tax=Sphingomonas cannabina TaxID=2899123 RepID=UPI001F41ED13|nr:MipA/OmpV family protein [Sphingomonas cannabina]UIJ45870.1 MipA/OmpV family protein [Sphingomonas cannabina]
MIERVAPLAALAIALAAVPAAAQDNPPPPAEPRNDSFATIGVGIATVPDYEGSDDNRIAPFPAAMGQVSGYRFTLIGNRLSVDLIRNRPGPGWDLQLGPVAAVNFNRSSTKSIDDPRIKALGKVDTAIELGGYAGIARTGVITSDYDRLSVSVTYRHDVAGSHDSGIWTPTVSYMTPLSRKAMVGLFASADHVEGKYARTYFSVTPGQSIASGLPVYNARGGWKNLTLGAMAGVSLTGDLTHGLSLVGGGAWSRLMNDFADSPVTSVAGDRNQWIGTVGLAYTF